jgi:hypothetical protein
MDNFVFDFRDAKTKEERDTIRQQAIGIENFNRTLFAQDRTHKDIQDPYASLIRCHPDQPPSSADVSQQQKNSSWKAVPLFPSEQEIPVIMPVDPAKRIPAGKPSIVDHDEFLMNWRLFTENSLQYVDYTNVFAAGGSVLACMLPVPESKKKSVSDRRTYLRETFAASDVDL